MSIFKMVFIWKHSIQDRDKNEWLTTTPTQAFSSNLRSIHKIPKNDFQLRNVCPSVCLFTWNNSAPTAQIFTKSDIREFFEILSKKFNNNNNNNNNNNIYLLQLGCHPVAVVILHVNKT